MLEDLPVWKITAHLNIGGRKDVCKPEVMYAAAGPGTVEYAETKEWLGVKVMRKADKI